MKRKILVILLLLTSSPLFGSNPFWNQHKSDDSYQITVYRNASCGCCKGWIQHLKEHNFEVKDVIVDDVNVYKTQLNVPPQAASCHTAQIDGVVIEGHVPAQDIKKVLSEKSDIHLLTVPAMPSGTPGMDTPGATKDNFNVYSISKEGKVSVFQSYVDY